MASYLRMFSNYVKEKAAKAEDYVEEKVDQAKEACADAKEYVEEKKEEVKKTADEVVHTAADQENQFQHDVVQAGVDYAKDKGMISEHGAQTIMHGEQVVEGVRTGCADVAAGLANPNADKDTMKVMADAYHKGGGGVDGVLDASNVVNPVYHAAVAGIEAKNAVDRGDYKEAGRQGTHAAVDVAATAAIACGAAAAAEATLGAEVVVADTATAATETAATEAAASGESVPPTLRSAPHTYEGPPPPEVPVRNAPADWQRPPAPAEPVTVRPGEASTPASTNKPVDSTGGSNTGGGPSGGSPAGDGPSSGHGSGGAPVDPANAPTEMPPTDPNLTNPQIPKAPPVPNIPEPPSGGFPTPPPGGTTGSGGAGSEPPTVPSPT